MNEPEAPNTCKPKETRVPHHGFLNAEGKTTFPKKRVTVAFDITNILLPEGFNLYKSRMCFQSLLLLQKQTLLLCLQLCLISCC